MLIYLISNINSNIMLNLVLLFQNLKIYLSCSLKLIYFQQVYVIHCLKLFQS